MGNLAQYALTISLFIGIPVGVQWVVGKLSARRAARSFEELTPVAVRQAVHE